MRGAFGGVIFFGNHLHRHHGAIKVTPAFGCIVLPIIFPINAIYVPLKASQPDLETSLPMNERVQLARGMNPKLQAVALIAMAPTNPVVNEPTEAQKILQELSEFTPSQVMIRERKVYRDAMTAGQGVVELGNDKATAEIEALAQEIYG